MKQKNNKKIIWISVLALLVCICSTTYIWMDRMQNYQMDDDGAIALTPDNLDDESLKDVEIVENVTGTTEDEVVVNDPVDEKTLSQNAVTRYVQTNVQIPTHPGMETSDDSVVWGSESTVEIFRIAYENGENNITVKGNDHHAVIAPGTTNTYTFKLKNTGDVGLDYTLNVEAVISPSEVSIPVEARLNRYDGQWIAGDSETFVDILALNGIEDNDLLSQGRYTYYTLEWKWPFESGNDELDTMLGNLATEQDVTLSIRINTSAVPTQDYFIQSGIIAPNTGDDGSLGIWIALTVTSLFMMILLIYYKRKTDDEDEK